MDFLKLVGLLALIIAPIAAYVTHAVWWIKLLIDGQMDTVGEGFLALAGMICPPVGVIHGFIIWF